MATRKALAPTAGPPGVVGDDQDPQRDEEQGQEWAVWIEPLSEDESPNRELRPGFDTQARLLETVVLVFDAGDELVIHAMPARGKSLDLLS